MRASRSNNQHLTRSIDSAEFLLLFLAILISMIDFTSQTKKKTKQQQQQPEI